MSQFTIAPGSSEGNRGRLRPRWREENARKRGPVYYPCVIMQGNRTSEQWIAQYASSHQHPVNRACHTLGIPTILLSVVIFIIGIFYNFHRLWLYALALFVLGWIFQFVGHAFEGKPPEFFSDWRFLFVGVRWWWAKIHGKA
ncbi:MAG: DUF962 domain-containing protein [Candidatus Sulfotelmatobacter sp.]